MEAHALYHPTAMFVTDPSSNLIKYPDQVRMPCVIGTLTGTCQPGGISHEFH